MSEERRHTSSVRRLAAIMFSDIVGYTAMMGSDEDKAFEILRMNRNIHTSSIEKFDGTLIKEMGDGMLAQFNTAADAVRCAIDIQQQASKDFEAQIRIGIHLGDITLEEGDVFGDGVNIASRLQSITDPGGIYISENVQKSIRAKNDIKTKYLGKVKLKNVDYPIKTFYITGNDLPAPSRGKKISIEGKSIQYRIIRSPVLLVALFIIISFVGVWIRNNLSEKSVETSSLLVLPPDNYTATDTLDYFLAGIHSSLIGDIGKISALRVPSKTTANAYKASGKSIPEIASELNVEYVIEPSVMCLGDTVCIQVKLMSVFPEEKQIWMNNYFIESSQIQNWYRGVTREISEGIGVSLTTQEKLLLTKTDTVNPSAYNAYLKGLFYLDRISRQSLEEAEKQFNLAIKLSPDWASPHAGMTKVWGYRQQMSFVSNTVAVPKIYENLNKMLELDPNSATSHSIVAERAIWTEWNWKKGEKEYLKTLELNPNDALSRMFYAHLLMILRRDDEALEQAKTAYQLDPLRPFILGLYNIVLMNAGRCDEAVKQSEKAYSLDPENYFGYISLIRAYHCIGEDQKAFDVWEEINWEKRTKHNVVENYRNAFKKGGWIAAQKEAIRIHEEVFARNRPNDIDADSQAGRYLMLGMHEKAIDWYEQMYDTQNANLPYISKNSIYDKMKDNPRYIELLKKMNLPIP